MDYLFTSFYLGMFYTSKCTIMWEHWVAHWCSEFFICAIDMQGYLNAYLKLLKEVISM